MPASEHYFETRRTARFYLIGEPGPKITSVLFALHGYGFLAKYFARRFETINRQDVLIVVPEGLHRYYLDGEHKRVGASWMTKEDRLTDISDQVFYLDGLMDRVLIDCPAVERTLVLGFSQGTATASRWVAQSKHPVHDLILWSGALPPDLNEQEIDVLRHKKLCVAQADADEYISEERFQKELERLAQLDLEHGMIRFTGKHEIPEIALNELLELIDL